MKQKLTKGEKTTTGSLPHEPVITMKNWEERFDERFLTKSKSNDIAIEYVETANIIQDTAELKSFISQLLEEEVRELLGKYQIMVGEHKYQCECKAGNDYLDKFLQVLREDKKRLQEELTPRL